MIVVLIPAMVTVEPLTNSRWILWSQIVRNDLSTILAFSTGQTKHDNGKTESFWRRISLQPCGFSGLPCFFLFWGGNNSWDASCSLCAEATRVDLWSQTSYEFPRHRVGFPKWSYPTSRSCGTRPRRTPLPWRGEENWGTDGLWWQRWRCVEKPGWQHLCMLHHRLMCKDAYADVVVGVMLTIYMTFAVSWLCCNKQWSRHKHMLYTEPFSMWGLKHYELAHFLISLANGWKHLTLDNGIVRVVAHW